MNTKEVLDVDVQIINSSLHLAGDALQSERWKAFANGEHIATLKGNRLIVRKA